MKGKVVAECVTLAVLGIISAAAGFAAEATKIKASEVRIEHFSCVYPSSPALGLGILAAISVIINRIIILILVGCCCRTRDSTSTPFSRLFNILSLIVSIIAVILLLGGAALNNREGGQRDDYGRITCYVVKPGIFAAGAVFSFLSACFGIVAYISASSDKQTTSRLEFPLPVARDIDVERSPVHPQH